MAGGPLAETTTCMVCLTDAGLLTRATRTVEGRESDEYRCEKGHVFSIDWSAGAADEPQWPPTEETRQAAEALARQRRPSP